MRAARRETRGRCARAGTVRYETAQSAPDRADRPRATGKSYVCSTRRTVPSMNSPAELDGRARQRPRSLQRRRILSQPRFGLASISRADALALRPGEEAASRRFRSRAGSRGRGKVLAASRAAKTTQRMGAQLVHLSLAALRAGRGGRYAETFSARAIQIISIRALSMASLPRISIELCLYSPSRSGPLSNM